MSLEGGGCGGEWRYPRHCSPLNGTCDYRIKWLYKSRKVLKTVNITWRNDMLRKNNIKVPPVSVWVTGASSIELCFQLRFAVLGVSDKKRALQSTAFGFFVIQVRVANSGLFLRPFALFPEQLKYAFDGGNRMSWLYITSNVIHVIPIFRKATLYKNVRYWSMEFLP